MAERKKKEWLRVDVRGDNREVWDRLRTAFVARVQSLLDTTLDPERGTSLREEAKEFASRSLSFARAKLEMPSAELQKLSAETELLFAKRQREIAEAEKTSEETRAIRIENDLKELQITLAVTKALLVGESGNEAMLLGQCIESLQETVSTLRAESK